MNDLISRRDAINIANDLIISVSGYEQHNHAVNSYSAELMKLPSAETDLIAKIQIGINATNTNDSYSCGMRNGMRLCMSLVDDKEPLFENCPSAEPQFKKGKWIDTGSGQECSECHEIQYGYDSFRYFCAFCGADMRGEQR